MNNSPRYPQRVRNDLRFRELTVLRAERISAGFQRIVLGGEALDGFTSRGFDDHSKLFFPQSDAHFVPPTVTEEGIVWPEGPRPPSRDYTPLYDELRHELAIDFFIHDGASPAAGQCRRNRAINSRWQVRAVRWWCQRITRISCMSAMNPECPHCAAAWKR
ncbi:siderophore-interacting protein [Escherichia coli]|uniref:siderophore-interacting protein n=1 Tax=Escherichia coli TaxID=562 RepID=UPI0032E8EAB8